MENEATVNKFREMLEARGVSRRSFLGLCGTIAAAAGLSQLTVGDVEQALADTVIGKSKGNLYPVIWIEGASCTGCTESFAQVDEPDPAMVVLEMISLNYNETLSAAAGYSMEEARKQTIEAGNYILVYEGALLKGWDGNALRVAMETGLDIFLESAKSANAVVALGSCAVNGGWMAAHPDAAGALGCQQYLKENGIDTPVINIPGCPANPEWLEAVLVDVVLEGKLPELNSQNKPTAMFGETIHDNCERRGHFENGEFVYKFGTVEEEKYYCLYALGCRGPQTHANCGVVRWNHRRSWCVESGAPCIGCCEADPNNPSDNWVESNTPFLQRNRDLRVGDWVGQPATIAGIVTGIVAVACIAHGFGMKKQGKFGNNATNGYEDVREWDAAHPDQSVGTYDAIENVKAANEKEGE